MPVTDQKTDRQDITDLKHRQFMKPLETAGVSKFTECVFHGAFHQNNVAQVCSYSSTLALRSVMTSRVCRADIIPRIREAQKNDNKQQYGSAEIRCT